MNRLMIFAVAVAVLAAAPQFVAAQPAEAEMREQFDAVIDGLNNNTFSEFQRAVDENELVNRIFGTRVIDADAREQFADSFSDSLQQMFISSFPRPRTEEQAGGEIIGTTIAFQFQGGKGRAIVRYEGEGYRFSYHSYELTSSRNRLVIVDWFDYYNSTWFSEDAGNMLVRAMPSRDPVRSIMRTPNPSAGQVFQVGELLKAARDQNPQRFFQIYDGLDEVLRAEPHVIVLNYQFCSMLGDRARLDQAVAALVAAFPGDSLYSLGLADYYIRRNLFEEGITELERFEAALGMKDGVSESFKATSAMALGDFERAQAFALRATEVEPELELGWWTLLRTRTAAANYAGATEAMTQLEERFGELLIPQKLRRDRFLKVLIDQQEYKDWRAERDRP